MKKEMKRRAATDHQKILDENKDFYSELVAEHYPNQTMTDTKFKMPSLTKISFIAAAIIILIVTATLLAIFLPGNNDDSGLDDIKQYFDGNVRAKTIELSEIETNLNSFTLNVIDYEILEVKLLYDLLSEDELGYRLRGEREDGLEEWTIQIIVNEYYEIAYIQDNFKSQEINNYTVMYRIECEEEDGIYIFSTHAVIEFEKEAVHIKYTCVAFEEDENTFFDWLSKVITKK